MGKQGEVAGGGVDRVMDEGQGVRGGERVGRARRGRDGELGYLGNVIVRLGDCSCCLVFEDFALSCFLSFYFVL